MSTTKVTLQIDPASDGTGATPGAASHYRDDQYYLDAIAERWIKDQGRFQPGVTYTLSNLPAGFAGFAKGRENSKHVDRYLYGHPNGIFRSMNELYPHFKHLQDNGGSIGCPCKLCTGKKPASSKQSGSTTSTPRPASAKVPKPKKQKQSTGILQYALDAENQARQKQIDDEGSEDIYRKLLDKLKEAGPDGINQNFIDQASPDWRAGHELIEGLLTSAQKSPRFEPRLGELVLFDRTASSSEGTAWDSTSQTPRKYDFKTREWLNFPQWEAGVVTQIPVEPLSSEDLTHMSHTKKQGVTYSGYRVEALTPLSTKEKPIASQHKYAPLHAIRPFAFWKDCIKDPSQAHPTIAYATKVTNSFCVIGKQRIEGQWPAATLFAQGVYIGSELVLVGDAVRLLPCEGQQQITDIMIISSIRLRFVNLEEANDDDYDDDHPYHTCLHISGKAFSLDPKKSFQGGPPVSPGTGALPKDLEKYGQWFSILDPSKPKTRLEVPYSHVIGRCFEGIAMEAWWAPQTPGHKPVTGKAKPIDLNQGFDTIREARIISTQTDPRIDKANGKSWFWAESRIEQLDLHEVNDRFVGVRDEERDRAQMHTWRQALRILDGKRSNFDASFEALKGRQEQEQQAVENSAAFGMMGGVVEHDSGSGEDVNMEGLQLGGEIEYGRDEDIVPDMKSGEVQSGGEAMETGYDSDLQELAPPSKVLPQVIIDVSSDEDEQMAT